jgi:hypothetical protein
VTTDRFEQLARAQARALSRPALALEVIPHPLAGLDAAEAARRGRAVGERIRSALLLQGIAT